MPRRGSFERRLRRAFLISSLLPSLLLLGGGTLLLAEAIRGVGALGAWERVAQSGRVLIDLASGSDVPPLETAARRHRDVLSESVVQARRWEYLARRTTLAIPVLALVLGLALLWTAIRAARRMARDLSRPVAELVGWSERIGRGEPLAQDEGSAREEPDEFATLRAAFREMERELQASRAREIEAERARSWVGMARSVAHELKNPLTPIRLALRTLEARPGSPESGEALQVLSAETARLEELARSFAQFGRMPEGPASEVDLRELLDYLLRTHLPEGVSIRLRAPVDLPRVAGHYDALSRAFSNLLLNAADAVGQAGSVAVMLRATGPAVEARFVDSGPGIPEELLSRIWEPDFSTKVRGTGLGLALVRRTVEAHGGRIDARNRPEGGAEFRVLLPVFDREAEAGHPRFPAADDSSAASLPSAR